MIYHARYILPIIGDPIENGDVLVRDGAITAVGRDLADAHPEESTLDLGNAAILPGFVNAHCHLDYTLSRASGDGLNLWDWIGQVGFGLGRTPPYRFLVESATRGAVELARSGVTCIGDSTFSGAAVEAVESVGLRAVIYREIFGQSTGEKCAERFRLLLEEVRTTQESVSSRVRIGVSPHAVYTANRGLLELSAQVCADQGVPIAMHLAETQAETEYLVSGTGPIARWRREMGFEPMVAGMTPARYLRDAGLLREGVCLAHCVHVDADEIEMIAASGAGVAHCPRSNAFLGAGIAPVDRMLAAGVRVGLGTDSSASSLSYDFFEEMRFALAIGRAVAKDAGARTAKGVLRQATLGGAEALGLSREVGSLETGKRADLVAVDMASLADGENLETAIVSRSPRDVLLVLVDGSEVARSLER